MLTVAVIEGLKPRHKRYLRADAHGLSLEVHPSGRKTWKTRFFDAGRAGKVALGVYPRLGLAEARARHSALRAAIRAGLPIPEARKAAEKPAQDAETVEKFAEVWLSRHVSKRRKDLAPIRRYLSRDVYPMIGMKRLNSVEKKDFREII